MFKGKEKMMDLKVKNSALLDALRSYSARQLQFAIRLGILPTPDKLNLILSRKSGSEDEIKLLVRNLSSMKV
jgi:hypothetical protein